MGYSKAWCTDFVFKLFTWEGSFSFSCTPQKRPLVDIIKGNMINTIIKMLHIIGYNNSKQNEISEKYLKILNGNSFTR